jgi:ABC-type glycerol-3-phosphate transport system substrate-binding protein
MSVKERALSIGACLALTAVLVGSSNVAYASRPSSANHATTTVTLMTWETPATNALIDKAMATFMKLNPTITVQRLSSPSSNYGQKLTSMIVAHKLPDLFWAGNDTEQQYGAQGLLYDWTSMANTASAGYNIKNFAPLSIANWSVAGHIDGLPSLMNTYGVWYNISAFKAAGLPLPTVGWTYTDMFHDAQVLTSKMTGSGTHYGLIAPPDDPFSIGQYSMSAGGAPFINDIVNPTKVTISPQFIQGTTLYEQAISKGYLSPPNFDSSNSPTDFAGGKIPMLYGGQWLAAGWLLSPPKFKFGFSPMPIVSKRVQPYDAVGIVSPKYISNPAAVWKVLQYLDTTAWETILPASPVAPSSYVPSAAPYFNTLKTAGLNSVADSVNYELTSSVKSGIRFDPTWATKAGAIITAQWNDILLGKTPVAQGSNSMATALNQLISSQTHS